MFGNFCMDQSEWLPISHKNRIVIGHLGSCSVNLMRFDCYFALYRSWANATRSTSTSSKHKQIKLEDNTASMSHNPRLTRIKSAIESTEYSLNAPKSLSTCVDASRYALKSHPSGDCKVK